MLERRVALLAGLGAAAVVGSALLFRRDVALQYYCYRLERAGTLEEARPWLEKVVRETKRPRVGAVLVCLPLGRWTVEFTNGVTEVCEISKDGAASVVEPRRTSCGKATVRDWGAVIVYEDDRVERWTPVGQRFVVEHWHPAGQFPSGTPILGIAERVDEAKPEKSAART